MGTAVQVTNAMEIFDPVVMEIEAHTEAMEAIAACQGQALQNIALNPVCAPVSAEEVNGPAEAPCCRSETLMDTPETGDVTERTTCTDGSIVDVVTYADGQTCTFNRRSADSPNTVVALDENGNLCTVGAISECMEKKPGRPYPEYFVPKLSDFGNPIFCVPGQQYGLAWSDVDSKNVKKFIEETPELPDALSGPRGVAGNQYRAEVDGLPYACGYNVAPGVTDDSGNPVYIVDCAEAQLDTQPIYGHRQNFDIVDNESVFNSTVSQVNGRAYRIVQGEEAGVDGDGNPVYVHLSAYTQANNVAHTVQDPNELVISPTAPNTTVARDADGNVIPGNLSLGAAACDLHPLQVRQQNKLDGCFASFGILCPAWDGKAPAAAGQDDEDAGNFSVLADVLGVDVDCPEIEGKTAQDAYFMLWKDWWCSEKKSRQIQQRIYALQIPVALYGLITSINTYNKLLDKNLDMICDVEENLGLLKGCSESMTETLKECQASLLEGHQDRLGLLNARGEPACKLGADEFDCYSQIWSPIQKHEAPIMADRLRVMMDNGKLTSEHSQSWADNLDECVTRDMIPEMKRQFAPLMASMGCVTTNLNQWREDLKDKARELHDHWERTYKTPEASMIPHIMDMSACAVQRVCELRDWLYASAQSTDRDYRSDYQPHEAGQAQAAMNTSAIMMPKIVESAAWLERNIPYALDIFKRCYVDSTEALNQRVFDEATGLAPELTRCYEWFRDNACDYADIYDKCYRVPECKLVAQQIELTMNLLPLVEDSLRRVDAWAQQDRAMFDLEFRSREIESTQTIDDNGRNASDQHHVFGRWLDERAREFHDTYHHDWLPCDQRNIRKHCEVWDRMNPLQGIERNSDEMAILSQEFQDFASKGIEYAHTYMDKVFAEQDRFEYCVETPAYLHVRRQVDRAVEELERCTPRHCTGHFIHSRNQLKSEGARAEGAAYEAAERWKWWANEQLQRKEYEQRLGMMQIIDGYAVRAIDASKTETAGYDLLLNHMSNALVRGQVYLQNMQESASRTLQAKQFEVEGMLRAIQLWHFWPELALRQSNEFHGQSLAMVDDAQQLLQMGHFWPDAANREKNSAVTVIGQGLDVSTRLQQLGQFYFQQAEQMNAQRTQAAAQAGQIGNEYARTGHNLHRIAGDRALGSLQQSIAAASPGLSASEVGQRHEAQALEIENRMTLNALEHMRAGIAAFGVSTDFLQEVRQAYQLSGSYGLDASTAMLNLFRQGEQGGLLALKANEQCYEMNFRMMEYAKQYLQTNWANTQQAIHGNAGTIQATNSLLGQTGDAVGSAFGLLGNSLEGLAGNSTPMPFPTGGSAFAGGGGTFAGFTGL